MKNITWSGRVVLSLLLAAAGSGLLLRAQNPQQVGTFAPMAFGDQRSHAASAILADGRTLIAGGFDADGNASAGIVIFNPADGSITAVGELPAPRVGHSATALKDGRVLIAGGLVDGAASASLAIFNPVDGTTTALDAVLSSARSGHAAARLADGTVLIAGGSDGSAALATTDIFDPETGAVAASGAMNVARAGASATLLIDNRVLVAGGNNGAEDLLTAEIYYPFAGTWEFTTTNLSVARSGHAAVLLPWNASVLIAGGQTTIDGVPTPVATADLFLPAQFPDPYSYGMGTFVTTAPNDMSAARPGAFGGPYGDNGFAFVAGGAADADRYRFATIKTDKDDYPPGMRAVITGSGWQPGEVVTLVFQEDPAVHEDYVLHVTADAEGNIHHDEWAPDEHDLNVRFYLMAYDSRSRAQATFTDANNFNITPASQSVAAGSTTSFSWTFTALNSANVGTTTFTIPAGWTTPQVAAGPGQVTVAAGTCAASLNGVAGMVITINQAAGGCNNGTTFTLNYSNATAPTPATPPQTYTFVSLHGNDPTITVTAAVAVNTTTTVSNAFATYGDIAVTLSATVTPASGPAVNSGTVAFTVKQGATTIGVATTDTSVVAGAASVSYVLPVGTAAGPYTIEAAYTPGTGFNTSSGTGTLTIDKKDATWTTSPNSKTYGNPEPAPVTTGSGTGFLASDSVTATYARAAGESASPPTYHITATLSATPMSALNNYNITNAGAEFTINKRPATWTTTAASKTYGDPDPSPLTTGSGTNFVAADGVTATYTRAGGETVAGGPYHITATLSATPLAALDNYTITNDGADFTINKRLATWTTNPASKIYGDPEPAPLTMGSGSNFVAGDSVTATYSRAAGENASPPTYHITATLSATPLSALDNYIITNDGAAFTINKRLATWTTNPASKTYGDPDPSPLTTGSGTNFIAADNVTAAYARAAGENASPPTYHITAGLSSTGDLNNYIITNDGAEFTINKRLATWTTNPASKTYGDPDPSPLTTGNGSNFIAADNVTATYSRVAGENASPPTYHITATLGTTGDLNNYIITNDGAAFTINKRLATWTTNPASKTYGDPDPSPLTSGTGSNFVAADNVTATYSRVAGENASPPTYNITATLSATGNLNNYVITNDGAAFTINKRLATWTTDPNSKTYGDPDPSPLTTGSGSNFVPGDGVAATYTRVAGENASPPSYHITATLTATAVGALDNYIITNDGAEFTINKRLATWTTEPNSKTYGDPDPSPLTTGSGSNFVAGDGVAATYTRVAGENASPPTYHITATLTATAAGALDNYIITNTGAEFTIDKRLATWTTNPSSKTYGDPDPSPLTNGSGSNFVPGDGVAATYTRVAGENASPPSYHITATLSATPMSALDNYIITNTGAEFTIDKRLATWTTNPASKTYGDPDPSPLTSGSGSNFVAGDAVTATYTRVAGENAGVTTYHITATLSASPMSALDNYSITNAGAEFAINKRPIQVTATVGQFKTYGDANPVYAYTLTSGTLAFSDSFTGALSRVAGENVGLYAITIGSLAVNDSNGGNNYNLSFVSNNFEIKKRLLTVKADAKIKTFGDPDPLFTFQTTVGSLALTDSFTGALTRDPGELVGTYAIKQGTLAINDGNGGANYTLTYVGDNLTILTACSVFNGFLPPIGGSVGNGNGGSFADPVRAFKLNSTIPVKFAATCFGAPLLTGVHTLQAIKYSNATDSDAPIDATPTDAATTGNQFRLTGAEWHFNLATKGLGGNAQGIWLLKATLFDGSTHSVWVSIKK